MLDVVFIIIGIIINIICIWLIKFLLKNSQKIKNTKFSKYLLGIPLGFILSLFIPHATFSVILLFSIMGGALGEIFAILFIIIQQNHKKSTNHYYDCSTPSFYITGDKHRNFDNVKKFCKEMNTKRHDTLIILGDAGFNYYGDWRDDKLKKEISKLNITLFCIHGNKENRPQNVGSYGFRSFCGGKVYYEPDYPNIFFAIDGQIYTFEEKKYIVIGGAHSIDKDICIKKGKPFWSDEIPDDTIKKTVENSLRKEGYQIHGIMSHTCPLYCLPTEMFISTRKNVKALKNPHKSKKKIIPPKKDYSTEIWLDQLEQDAEYNVWFCGHYHIDKQIDKVQMLYNEIRPLHVNSHN